MGISSALGSSALLPAGLGFRNVIINGGMAVSQRYGTTGVSFGAGGGTMYYGTDRFSTEDYTWSAGTNPTVKQATSSGEGISFPAGFDYAYKINTGATGLTLSSGGVIRIRHVVEGFNALPLYGKQCYLSFWVRSSKTGTYTINMSNGNWGAGLATRMIAQEFTINAANTWEYKTIAVDMATATASGTWNKSNGFGLSIEWILGANADRTGDTYKNAWQTFSTYQIRTSSSVNWAADANATFYLTGVQLEQNYQPTPFEQRPIGVELQLCQRYYWQADTFQIPCLMQSGFDNKIYAPVTFFNGVAMRATPTAAITSTPYVTDMVSNLRNITSVSMVTKMVTFSYDSTKLTSLASYAANFNDTGRTLSLSAEL